MQPVSGSRAGHIGIVVTWPSCPTIGGCFRLALFASSRPPITGSHVLTSDFTSRPPETVGSHSDRAIEPPEVEILDARNERRRR